MAEIERAIGQSLAPAFLLTGIFSALNVLAGRLGPENVAEAITRVGPWAVDAASSLESSPGIKDHARVRAYVEAARR